MPKIIIDCTKMESDGVTPCIHNDCRGCALWGSEDGEVVGCLEESSDAN